jgi:FAD/FMN-containing dehydrogenase
MLIVRNRSADMTIMETSSRTGRTTAAALQSSMPGKVLLPFDDGYAEARRIWNGAIDHRPALIVRCETTRDVQSAVRAAATYGLPLSVRGGGHDWAGRSVSRAGLMIDLSPMRQVEVKAGAKVAIVGGGATVADVNDATAPHGLAAVTGNCGTVGITGLTPSGGYSLLSGKYGLALDNLLEAEVVLANGQFVRADATHNEELFWALRGGGNLGIVTSMRIRLHPMRSLLGSMMLFPWSEAEPVLRGYAEIVTSAPDSLSVMAGVISAADHKPVLFLAPAWCGEPTDGEPIIAALQNLGNPIMAKTGPMTYRDLVAMFDPHLTFGRHHVMHTCWLSGLSSNAISALGTAGGVRTSPLSVIALHYFHGAAARVRKDATAFGLRREHFLVEILASWGPLPEDNGAGHQLWAQNLLETLTPAALPGGYPNQLGRNDRKQIAPVYGDNLARLQDAKQRFDPDHVLSGPPLPREAPHTVLARRRIGERA